MREFKAACASCHKTDNRASALQEAITAAEEGGVMSIRQDSNRSKIRDAREFRAIRVWLAKCMEKDELAMLARLSVFLGSFNAEGAAAIGKVLCQPLPHTPMRWHQSPLLPIAAAVYSVLAPSTRSGVKSAGAVAFMACIRFGKCMHASEPAYSESACGHGGREVAAMLEDMKDSAVLEADVPVCSAERSQPAAAGLLARRYKMHALIREVAKDILKDLQGSGVEQAFIQWMVSQAHQLRKLVPESCERSPASAAQLITNEIINFRQIFRALASIQPACTSAPLQASLCPDVEQLVLDLIDCGCLADAELIGRQSLIRHESVLGQEHPDTLSSWNVLALVLYHSGKLEEAAGMQRQVLEAQERVLGHEHPVTLMAKGNLALSLQGLGKLKEAEGMLRQLLEAQERVLEQEH